MHFGFRNSAPRLLPALVMFTILCSTSVRAQSSPDRADPGELLQRLQNKIDQLEASQKLMQEKIDHMGAAAPAAQPPEAAAPPPAETIEAQPEAPLAHVLGPVQLHGFSDIDYGRAWFEKLPPGGLKGSTNSFTVGDFDLYTNTQLSESWNMLGEMLVSSDFSNEFSVEMDRLLLTYKKNDYFKISFGKFASALGYYTNQFHRAQYFQTGIGRPIMYADEDNNGILPVHNIGVTATGLIPSGRLGLHWVAEVANGRSSTHPDIPLQNFVDDNNGKAVNLAFYARPEKINGLQVGVSLYHETLHPLNLPQVGEVIVTAHAVYVGSKLEWLNEGSLLRHSLKNQNQTFYDPTAYTQVSWAFGKTRPYFRYDYQNVPGGDPIFGSLARLNGPSLGVNRHLSNYVILKLQYGRLAERQVSSTNDFSSQLAFAF